MVNIAGLMAMKPEEVRALAAKHGIQVHHKAGQEKVAHAIVEHVRKESMKNAAEAQKPVQAKPEPVLNSEDDIRKAIERHAAKEDFTVEFPGDETWIFRCKGAEESGHMTMPMRIIKQKAESVANGARKPRMVKIDDEYVMHA